LSIITGHDRYRVLIAAGMFASRFAVIGELASDGAVELVALELDLGPPDP